MFSARRLWYIEPQLPQPIPQLEGAKYMKEWSTKRREECGRRLGSVFL